MFKVLIIDDDEVVRLFLGRLLTNKFECNVLPAENGLEGLSLIEKEKPDVIFLDITMPVMDGVETLELIRKDPKFRNLPVIMLTAIKDKQTVSTVMGLGVISYLLKPLQYNSAYEKIKELFEQIKRDKDKVVLTQIAEENAIQKILIVDADEEYRAIIKKKLDKGFEIFESSSGAEGLKLYMQEYPAIVFLGENLPLLNENRLAKKIKESAELARIKNYEVSLFIIKESTVLNEEEKAIFKGVIPRTKNLGVFLKQLSEVIKETTNLVF